MQFPRNLNWSVNFTIQLNFSTMAPWAQKKVAVIERFKQEFTYGLSAKEVAIVKRWPLLEV